MRPSDAAPRYLPVGDEAGATPAEVEARASPLWARIMAQLRATYLTAAASTVL